MGALRFVGSDGLKIGRTRFLNKFRGYNSIRTYLEILEAELRRGKLPEYNVVLRHQYKSYSWISYLATDEKSK